MTLVQTDANDPKTVIKDLTTSATPEVVNGVKTGYYIADSGVATTISIRPGWNLRFINLPNGTTYTITESGKEGYTFLNAAIDNNGIFSLQEGTATGSGTINESNTQYTVTYTNQASTQQVYIHKTGQDGKTPLKGAVFSLYSKEDYEAEPKKAMKTDLTSDELGKIDLGRQAVGEYYLVETKAPDGYNLLTEPVKIIVKGNEVSYQQIENSMSISNNGVSGNNLEGYTLVVTNNEGYELPATGGPGTRLFTILGTALIAGAGLLLWMTRKSADFAK